ncbi:polymeric immunoglobulin receptor isoform X3 [Salmo trutta]|uniref:polymeric immunoglobulin receptor isoform X3 n=1 Tax=Salmo trutta TaxID=8032 RepID=UPI001130621D|nr:polymeric immunoglobulin receptor-like isoform X3 [Salmo trutta]
MRNLLILIILSFMTGCVSCLEVEGCSGGTVIFTCKYPDNYQSNDKYFCKESTQSCEEKIKSGMKNTWENKDRFSLCDTNRKLFTVIIRKLEKSDEGNYKCEVATSDPSSGHVTIVELKVKEDDCFKKSVKETAYLGRNATITCKYPEDHENRTKYFCKQDDRFICKDNITLESEKISNKHGRLFVSDNRRERVFTVTFTNLTVEDTGVYWCGGKTHVYTTLITEVELAVNAPPKTTMVTTMSPASSSRSPPSPLNSTSVVTIVSVSLGGLVFAAFLVIVYSCKRNKQKGAASSTHRLSTDAGNNGKSLLLFLLSRVVMVLVTLKI